MGGGGGGVSELMYGYGYLQMRMVEDMIATFRLIQYDVDYTGIFELLTYHYLLLLLDAERCGYLILYKATRGGGVSEFMYGYVYLQMRMVEDMIATFRLIQYDVD